MSEEVTNHTENSTDQPTAQENGEQIQWGQSLKTLYETVHVRGAQLKVGDNVSLFSESPLSVPLLCKITELYEDAKTNRPMFAGLRYFRKSDITNLDAESHNIKDNEIFASEEVVHHTLASIENIVIITEIEDHSSNEKLEEMSHTKDYYYRFWYDTRSLPQLLGQAPIEFYINHFHDREASEYLTQDDVMDDQYLLESGSTRKRKSKQSAPNTGEKKKRGRPRKDSVGTPSAVVSSTTSNTPLADGEKKKRGRPRKNPLPDPNTPRKKRGRPKKNEKGEETDENSEDDGDEPQESTDFETMAHPEMTHNPEVTQLTHNSEMTHNPELTHNPEMTHNQEIQQGEHNQEMQVENEPNEGVVVVEGGEPEIKSEPMMTTQ